MPRENSSTGSKRVSDSQKNSSSPVATYNILRVSAKIGIVLATISRTTVKGNMPQGNNLKGVNS